MPLTKTHQQLFPVSALSIEETAMGMFQTITIKMIAGEFPNAAKYKQETASLMVRKNP
jgi:hypothetical protein